MPANEQTLRDQKQLHRVFAASGVVMLLATVLMFYADHNRRWKQYQETFRQVEQRRADWEAANANRLVEENHAELEAALRTAKSQGFGYVGPVLIVSDSNDFVDGLDAGDLAAIFSGEAASWKELRGSAPGRKIQIVAAVDEETPLNRLAGAAGLEGEVKASLTKVKDAAAVVERVSGSADALGIVSEAWWRRHENEIEGVSAIALPGQVADFRWEVLEAAERAGESPPSFAYVIQDTNRLYRLAHTAEKARRDVAELEEQLSQAEAAHSQAGQAVEPAESAAEAARDKLSAAEKAAAAEGAGPEAQQALADAKAASAQAGREAKEASSLVKKLAADRDKLAAALRKAREQALDAEASAVPVRERVVGALEPTIQEARFREDLALSRQKFTKATLDAKTAALGLAVRDQREGTMEELQAEVNALKADYDELVGNYQTASQHRKDLEEILGEMTAEETEAQKAIDDNRAEIERLATTQEELQSTWFIMAGGWFPWFGKRWLELPILDAFNSPKKIDNQWNENNRIDYNFSEVRRFDRCTTCHRAMEKTQPGSAVEPAYEQAVLLEMVLSTPTRGDLPERATDDNGEPRPYSVEEIYGFSLSPENLLGETAVTVTYVRPYTAGSVQSSRGAQAQMAGTLGDKPATADELRMSLLKPPSQADLSAGNPSQAGLKLGDEIVKVNGGELRDLGDAAFALIDGVKWGETLTLTVRRGLPHPFTTHPRLDLYLGSVSPHKLSVFGCTNCHEGQGSATSFEWASHSPNDPEERRKWVRELGWFDNHHWIFPMYPERFRESSCLKCHHDVAALDESERYPDPPAPKVVKGYELLTTYGCFGCHEINGFDGPNRRVGPDIRLEPNYFAAALELKGRLAARLEVFGKESDRLRADLGPYDQLVAEQIAAQTELDQLGEKTDENQARFEEVELRLAELAPRIDKLAPIAGNLELVDEHVDTIIRADELADRVLGDPAAMGWRHKLVELLSEDQEAQPDASGQKSLDESIYLLADLFADSETPGSFRRVGPSLRHVAAKDDREFLYDWIRNPQHFRPTTRMPRFFGLHEHLEHEIAEEARQAAEVILREPNIKGAEEGELAEIRKLAEQVRRTAKHDDRMELRRLILTAGEKRAGQKVWETAQPAAPVEENPPPKLVDDAEQFEPVEILGIVEYLSTYSQPFPYLSPAADLPEAPVEERVAMGKMLFETRGCLACHSHDAFPGTREFAPAGSLQQGPDLSGIAEKFSPERNPDGKAWLYTWLKQPSAYHSRTFMPDLFLDPIELPDGDASGNVKEAASPPDGGQEEAGEPAAAEPAQPQTPTRLVDPAAEIVEFLMAESPSDWRPAAGTLTRLDRVAGLTLDELVQINLEDAFYRTAAARYNERGIPERMRVELKGAETELLVPEELYEAAGKGALTAEQHAELEKKRLLYIGRKTISRYGCYGCHDIPGFEEAKPIGTGLADWGRKDPSRLAFEHIIEYLGLGHLPPGQQTFYDQAILSSHRSGFIHQKLAAPRSYDYHKTENKTYNERLRMPEFPLTETEREEIITFVLGLVADPPHDSFVYQPAPRQQAILAGKQVLEKYNCSGCHLLSPEEWRIKYTPEMLADATNPLGDLTAGEGVTTYPFVNARFTYEELAASAEPAPDGFLHATLRGMPALSDADGRPDVKDQLGDDLDPEFYGELEFQRARFGFGIWEPVALGGETRQVGGKPFTITPEILEGRRPAKGGVLTRYLLPRVVAMEKRINKDAKGSQAWGWLPPPLMGEGSKVEPDWLYSFLLDPHRIRPAAVLRMPRFNLSPEEATALVNYFAAVDAVDYPYDYSERRRREHLAKAQRQFAERMAADDAAAGGDDPAAPASGGGGSRLDAAMRIVTSRDYCVQCHIVGDYVPVGFASARSPDLSQVYRRLRPDYTRKWIAHTTRTLPYTPMPFPLPPYDPNAPHLGGVKQELYPGTSVEQLDGLVDLLMNYDEFARRRASVSEMVKAVPAAEPPPEGEEAVPPDNSPPEAPPPEAPPPAGASAEGGDDSM